MSVKHNFTDIMTLYLLKTGRNFKIGPFGGGSSENSSICIFASSFLAIGSLLFSDFIAR